MKAAFRSHILKKARTLSRQPFIARNERGAIAAEVWSGVRRLSTDALVSPVSAFSVRCYSIAPRQYMGEFLGGWAKSGEVARQEVLVTICIYIVFQVRFRFAKRGAYRREPLRCGHCAAFVPFPLPPVAPTPLRLAPFPPLRFLTGLPCLQRSGHSGQPVPALLVSESRPPPAAARRPTDAALSPYSSKRDL